MVFLDISLFSGSQGLHVKMIANGIMVHAINQKALVNDKKLQQCWGDSFKGGKKQTSSCATQ